MSRTPAIAILVTLVTAHLASADLTVHTGWCAFGPTPTGDTWTSLGERDIRLPMLIRLNIPLEALETASDVCLLDGLTSAAALPADRFDMLQRLPIPRLAASSLHTSFGWPFHAGLTPATDGDDENVFELPPPPDAGMLTLSGLLTVAGVQLARSARHAGLAALLHAAHVPDWYHADAVQLGHSVPFEFQPTLQPMQSVFGLIASESDRPAPRFYRPEAEYRLRSLQQTLLVLAPRSPPLTQS